MQITHGQPGPAGRGGAHHRRRQRLGLGRDQRGQREAQGRRRQGLSVIGFDSKLPEFLPLWAKANGVDLLSADGRNAQLDDPKVVEALTWAVSIYDAQGGFAAVKAFRDAADFFGAGNQFATNTLGAMPMEQWYLNVLNDVSPDAPMAFDTVHDRKDGEPLAYASGSAWAIPKGSANPQAACRFAKTMTATDSWMKAAAARADARKADGAVVHRTAHRQQGRRDQIRQTYVKPSGDAKWDTGVEAFYTANDHTFSLPANPADTEFKTAWQDAVNRVLNGSRSRRPHWTRLSRRPRPRWTRRGRRWDEPAEVTTTASRDAVAGGCGHSRRRAGGRPDQPPAPQ